MTSRKILYVSLFVIEALWLQEVSAGINGKLIPSASRDIDSNQGTENLNIVRAKRSATINFGSRDVQIGNTYPENPTGTNVYGAILIQKNNNFRGKGKNVYYGARVTQVGNVYGKNPGKNDTYGPIIIQEGNTYSGDSNSTTYGVILNQINNTYPKALEGTDALNPIIRQNGNVYLGTGNVIESKINRSGNRFQRNVEENKKHEVKLGFMKTELENLKRGVDIYLRITRPMSMICANNVSDSERMQMIASLQSEMGMELEQIEALRDMNRSRKVVCDNIKNVCTKHDEMQNWIMSIKLILIEKIEKSTELWKRLQNC